MKSAPARFALLALVWNAACYAATDVSVISGWVMPTRPAHTWELKPHERTRPVVVGDIVYFANLDGDVFAFQRTDGYLLWRTKMPGAVSGSFAYGRSKLFVGDNKGNLIALNVRDGSEAWRYKTSAQWLAPVTVLRDKVFATSSSDDLYALSDADGKELWHYAHRGDEKMTIRGTAAPAAFAGEVFQGFSDGYLVSLTATDGSVRWTKKLRVRDRFYDVDATPYVEESRVIAATFDGKLYSLDRSTGDTQWTLAVGTYGGFYVEEDRVYFAGLDGNFYSVEKSTGQVIWKRPFGKGVGLAPAKAGDALVITTSSDPVYLVDMKNGDVLWTGTLGTGTMAAATGTQDGWFYCMSNYGNLFTFEILKGIAKRKGPETLTLPSALHQLAEFSRNHNAP